MIESRQSTQKSFFGSCLYDKLVPQNHILRKILEAVDFTFVDSYCKDLYCYDNGRPGWSPRTLFKILFLQFMYDLPDYAIEETLCDRLFFKMFADLEVDEMPPDHSTLSRFRDRLGHERFKELFNHIVSVAREKGIISDKLQIVDATDIQAKVDIYRIKKKHGSEDPSDCIDKHSPDKDARPGRKYKGKLFYGYQANCSMDAESEIIVGAHVSPGGGAANARVDNVVPRGDPPKVVTADKLYDNQRNHKYLTEHNIRYSHEKEPQRKISKGSC